jgi:cation diffusion facilitator family transporter
LVSIFAGAVILCIKHYAAAVSGSAALRSDAIESVVNVVAAVFALGAVIFAERPADRGHPYGHGKIEHFSAAFEGGLVALAAAFIMWEAAGNLYGQVALGVSAIKDLGRGLAWAMVGGAANGALGLFLVLMGRRHRSKVLEADGIHVLSDFVTTMGSMLALLVVKATGLHWLDPVVALALGLLLARTGFRLVKESSGALLDIEDPALVEKIVAAVNGARPKDIISAHGVRTLRSGRRTHIDIHMVAPSHISLRDGHDLAEGFGRAVVEAMGIEGEMHTHVDPCRKALCGACAVDPCPARAAPAPSPGPPAITVEGAVGDGGEGGG